MKLKIFIITLTLFCLISTVSALEKISVEQGSLKETSFEIKNNNPDPLRYTIYSVGWHPWILFSYSQVLIQPGESRDIKIFLMPNRFVEKGVYNVLLIAESGMDRFTEDLEITIFGEFEKPAVKEFLFDNENLNLTINSKEEFDLEISIYKGDDLLINIEEKISEGENKITKSLDLEPGDYLAKISFYKGVELVHSVDKSYSVQEVIEEANIVEKKEVWNYLFISGARVTFENIGEGMGKKEYSIFVDKSADSFFNSENYREKIDEGSQYNYKWEFVLLPNQKYTIIYSYNYSVVLILSLAVVFFAFLFYLSSRKEIKVKKFFANKVHGIREEKEIKICLEVINKTKQELNNIIVEDFVQPIFKLEKDFYGVKPNKIVKIGSEEKLVWEIPKLEPKETRVFIYKIIPKIGVSEKYSFSLARVKYKKDKISRILFSNSLVTARD